MIREAITGDDNPTTGMADDIGKAAAKLNELSDFIKDHTAAESAEAKAELARVAADLTELKAKAAEDQHKADTAEALATAKAAMEFANSYRTPSKARMIGSGPRQSNPVDTRPTPSWTSSSRPRR
jgi:ATPase subunit of ABC transporter with duplicated ATPase domains